MSCDNCLCQLPICQAECCKEFRIRITNSRKKMRQGMTIMIPNNDPDFELYTTLRGFKHDEKHVYITLDDFVQKGRYVYIISPCRLLTNDNLCSAHNNPNIKRPLICDWPQRDTPGAYVTPRCIYQDENLRASKREHKK